MARFRIVVTADGREIHVAPGPNLSTSAYANKYGVPRTRVKRAAANGEVPVTTAGGVTRIVDDERARKVFGLE